MSVTYAVIRVWGRYDPYRHVWAGPINVHKLFGSGTPETCAGS